MPGSDTLVVTNIDPGPDFEAYLDFGPSNSQVADGFELVTLSDPRWQSDTDGLGNLQRITGGALQRDVCYLKSIVDNISEVVSGGASGADHGGEVFAKSNDIPIKVFRAEWNAYGRAAGPIRNRKMAEYADMLVLFPGGRGTNSMYSLAKEHNLLIHDLRG